MGVSNVYNQAKANAIAAIKSNMATKGKKAEALKPEHLRMTGSIFNAPGINNQLTITDLNARKSINELTPQKNKQTNGTGSSKKDNNDMPDNAGEGRAKASAMQAEADKLSATTRSVEKDAGTVRNFNTGALSLNKEINENDKSFQKKLKTEQAELKRDNKKLDKLNKETTEIHKEVENAQKELDTLLARNSFNMGGSQSSSGSSDDQSKIKDLQTFIGSKVGVMQSNGKKIYSLQRNQSRTLTRMKRTNASFINTHSKNVKAMEQQNTKTNSVIDGATKAEGYAQMVQTGGQVLKTLGQAMIAASGTIFTAWMQPVGQVMAKIGTVAEMIGQYGVAAANITKTVAYAAEGNIMGAMQSAAAAVQSGAAAVKSTKNIKTEFGKINQQGKEATAKLEARKEVDQQKTNSLNELNKTSDGKSLIDTKGIVDENGNITNRKEFEKRLKAAGVTNEQIRNTKANAFGTDAKGNRISAKSARQSTASQIIDSEYKQTASEAFGKAKATGFKNVASNTVKKSSTNWSDKMNNLTKGFSSLGSMFGMSGGTGYTNGYNNMGYMNNGMPQTTLTDKQRKAAWRQRNAQHLHRSARA